MMTAPKKGTIKKKRTDPTRIRRPDPTPPSPETRRSLRPRRRRFIDDYEDDLDDDEEQGAEDRETQETRQLKVVLKLPPIAGTHRHVSPPDCSPSSSRSAMSASSDEGEKEEVIVKPLKKRRIGEVRDSDGSGHRMERKRRNVVQRPIRAVSGTPMPDRRVLEPILDKLQKKDTYGVFAQPVDPDELPDYHEVIEHLMDFGTVRRKLASGRYRTFEQFEDDVFLICSNAMQYNAPDTIYFRQAHSIEDMARKNFHEIRAGYIFSGAERKSEEKIMLASTEKKTVKKPHGGTTIKSLSSDISLREKIPKQSQCRNAHGPLGYGISSLENKTLKEAKYRTASPQLGSDISSMEMKTLKKPQYRTTPEPPGSDISSMRKKTIKKPQYRASHEQSGSDISSIEKKTLQNPQYRATYEQPGSDISSMEKKTLQKSHYRATHEPPASDVSSMGVKMIKKPQHRAAHEQPRSDIFSKEKKTLRKPQNRTLSEPVSSDISSMEKIAVKKPVYRSEPEPLGSNASSQEKKKQNEHESSTAPKPLGSDISFDATVASVSDTLTAGLSKIPANGDTSATNPCLGLNAEETHANLLAADTCTGLTTVQPSDAERSVTINGSVDGSSSLDESNLEMTDELPAKCLPSKIDLKSFVVDVRRRETYNTLEQQSPDEAESEIDVFEGEPRELVTVGLHSEHSYARSLARFAANLGPIAWDIASKRIEQALPSGVKFGAGWVGEYEPLPTPILLLAKSTPKQPTVTRKDKRNEIKSEAISRISKNEKGNRIVSEVSRSAQCKDMPFGLRSQTTTGLPSNIAFNNVHEGRVPSVIAFNNVNEGRVRSTREQKQELFAVNQITMQKQKNQPAANFITYANETAPNSTFSAVISNERNQVTGNFPRVYTNDKAPNYMGRNQMQSELPKQPEAGTSQVRNDGLGVITGNLTNWRSCDNYTNNTRPNTPFGIIPNHQDAPQYWLPRGSQEQATNDSLRWTNSTLKISDQPSTLTRCGNNLQQTMPTVHFPKLENPNASGAAAQAWMSMGASPRWKSVENGGVPSKQVGRASFRSNQASRIHEKAKIKPEPVYGASENSQSQAKGLVIFPQLMTTYVSTLCSPWQNRQKDTLPPDLNISFQPPGSPSRSSSGVFIDTQQPDLALQL